MATEATYYNICTTVLDLKVQQEEARLSFEQTLLNAGVEVNEALVQYQAVGDGRM